MQQGTERHMQHYPLVTIVGGSGFVGRHTVKLLAAKGYRIRVLVRDTVAAEFLKTAATVGQIAIEHADITRPDTLKGKFAGSDAVINLVSIMYQRGRQRFGAINVEGAKAVAREAKAAGAKSLIQISALGVERARDTLYGMTKLNGELAVLEAFPEATILRPALIIGPEDNFFQRFARMSLVLPVLPLIAGGKTRFQPVLVTDVAQAIVNAIGNPETRGRTFEIAGPKVYSFRELLQLMGRITKRTSCLISMPTLFARIQGRICEMLPFKPMITRDQVKLLAHDNVASNNAIGLFGITPTPIEDALPHYLARYVKV